MGELLDKLAKEQDNLLMAEVAALLHQMAKCSCGFIRSQLLGGANYPNFHSVSLSELSPPFITTTKHATWRTSKNSPFWEGVLMIQQKDGIRQISFKVNLNNNSYSLLELLATWHRDHTEIFQPGHFSDWLAQGDGYLIWLLDACHGVAHVEKADLPEQNKPQAIGITNAFGLQWVLLESTDKGKYGEPAINLDKLIQKYNFGKTGILPKELRRNIVSGGNYLFSQTISETTAPANEVTLWEWHWTTAALYKAYLASLYIQGKTTPASQSCYELSWRTLRVTIDKLGLLSRAHRLEDILAYKRAVDKVLSDIRTQIEETTPLGNQIYRDTTGAYFTFPHMDDDSLQKDLTAILLQLKEVKRYEEIRPVIAIGDPWKEDHDWQDADKLLSLPLQDSRRIIASGEWGVGQQLPQWIDIKEKEICPVCGIRPLEIKKPKQYRKQRCKVCEDRAHEVLYEWKKEYEKETIWIDEIADKHDRVAMIIGQFHLSDWLSGKMIRTLPITEPKNGTCQFKLPSPSRIMRIWRTTEEFWEKSVKQIFDDYFKGRKEWQRYPLEIDWQDIPKETLLDGTSGGYPLSIYQKSKGKFELAINPVLAGIEFPEGQQTLTRQFQIHNENKTHTFTVHQDQGEQYQPTRTILTTPDQFLALVPGQDALKLAKKITQKYSEEMGKVRSRLPMDLSIVYFHRKMPLYAVMDAARRFLQQKQSVPETWKVKQKHTHDKGTPYQREALLFKTLKDKDVECEDVTWITSTAFGDGTDDTFYPYVAGITTKQHPDYKVKVNEDKYIHISKLENGDKIAVTPSHFSYLWLDNTTRRYSIGAEDEDAPFKTQNMYLEEIEWQVNTWEKLQRNKITNTKLHGVIQLLLEKRMEWKDGETLVSDKNKTFVQFALDVLKRNKLYDLIFEHEPTGTEEALRIIKQLFRCFDLHYRIMKQRLTSDKKEGDN